MIPRLLWFMSLGGELPRPSRDQPVYIRMAASLVQGRGLSFAPGMAFLKNDALSNTDGALSEAWLGRADYVFGITPVDTPTATVEPGYPLLLAAAFILAGPVTGAVYLLNCIAFLAGALAVWRLVAGKWGEREGRVAAIVWAVYPWFVYFSAHAMSEAVHISLVPVVLYSLFRVGDGRSNGFATGLATGILFLVRSTALFMVPVELGYLFLIRKRRSVLPLLAGFLLCLAPWVIRNSIEMGSPVVFPTKGALNLWMRNNPEALRMEGIEIPGFIQTRRNELLDYPDFSSTSGELERSRQLGRGAVAYIVANPLLFLWLSGGRFISFMLPVAPSVVRGFSSDVGFIAGFAIYLPLLLLSCIEFWRRRRDSFVRLLVTFFLLYTLIHSFAHGGVRYRLPVDLIPIIGASLFFVRKFFPGPNRDSRFEHAPQGSRLPPGRK